MILRTVLFGSFIALTLNAPLIHAEDYACLWLNDGEFDTPKLLIDRKAKTVSFPTTPQDIWTFEEEGNACDVHTTHAYGAIGSFWTYCFHLESESLYISNTQFNVNKAESKSQNWIYRCTQI